MIIHTITWEDPTIELEILDEILLNFKKPNILMLATSCDTILTLLNNKNIHSITCISPLSRNLAILELKMHLLLEIKDYNLRLQFLEGILPSDQVIDIYLKFCDNLSSLVFWNTYIDILTHGLHLHDCLLKLFFKLKKNNNNFHTCFTYDKMIEAFSNNSISNSISMPYWKYFQNIFNTHTTKNSNNNSTEDNNNSNNDNPYYYLMTHFQYSEINKPKYLTNELPSDSAEKIKLIKQDFVKHLLDTTDKYAFISLGHFFIENYNYDELNTIFELLKSRIFYNGRLLVRQFNHDYNITEIINKFFIILNFDRNTTDKTYLYQNIIIAKPRPIRTP